MTDQQNETPFTRRARRRALWEILGEALKEMPINDMCDPQDPEACKDRGAWAYNPLIQTEYNLGKEPEEIKRD